jgi:hypothetical protein
MENFLLVVILMPIVLLTVFVLFPIFKGSMRIRELRKIGTEKAGLRGVDEIFADINKHNEALHVCKAELTALLELQRGIIPAVVEEPKTVNIVFNSKEIGCRYKGIEVPKYVKQSNDSWYEFESLALFDNEGRAIVDDAKSNYITVNDSGTQSSFFYRELPTPPLLNLEIEEEKLETV